MRFLTDENTPGALTIALREAGHDCAAVQEDHAGIDDEAVLALAVAEERILISFDSDFGRLIFRDRLPAPPGVIFVRLRSESAKAVTAMLVQLLKDEVIKPAGYFVVVEASGEIRSSRLEIDR